MLKVQNLSVSYNDRLALQEVSFDLPRGLQVEFSKIVQQWTDKSGKEVT